MYTKANYVLKGNVERQHRPHRKKAVDDGSTALIFTYKLITKNSDIY